MKANQTKGFTFKVADKKEEQSQVTARDGVATAGCTAVFLYDGTREWKMTSFFNQQRDQGYFC